MTETSAEAHESEQLLHLVFGGELKNLDTFRISRSEEDRHRRHFPQLRQRGKGVASQGASDGGQRPDALFHRASASSARAHRPDPEARLRH